MKNRSHALRIWCAQHDMTVKEFAVANGWPPEVIGNAINGIVRISPERAAQISKATKGAVSPQNFRIGSRQKGRPVGLTAKDADAIRKMVRRGALQAEAARQYNVTVSMVSRIVNGSRHKA
jgi:DNA-binding transcriptional regulator YdaS (Cro superfamily)